MDPPEIVQPKRSSEIQWRSQIIHVDVDTGEIITDYRSQDWILVRKQINHIIREGTNHGTREIQWLIRRTDQQSLDLEY